MRRLGLALGMAGLMLGAGVSAAGADETVKLGLMLTLSGPAAALGRSIDKGAMLYLKLHQADLPAGVRLAVIRRDNGGPAPERARQLAQELISQDKVQLLAGVVYAANAMAIAPLLSEAKVPLVLMNATSPRLTRQSRFLVRVSRTRWQVNYPLGEWAPGHGVKRVFVAASDDAADGDAAQGFVSGLLAKGGTVVGSMSLPRADLGETRYLAQIKKAKPQALYLAADAGALSAAAVKELADAGLHAAGITLIGPGSVGDDAALPRLGKAALGVVTARVYAPGLPRAQNRAFVAAWQREYGATAVPDATAVFGWDGMAAIFAVVERLKGKATGEAALDVLRHWQNPDSPRGAIAIDPETRDIVQDVYIDKVERVGGKLASVQVGLQRNVKDPWKVLNLP